MPHTHDDDYLVLSTGAHRKPAAVIGAPGIVQHYAFWQPPNVPKAYWHKSIDYLLFKIFILLWSNFSASQKQEPKFYPSHLFSCPNLDRGTGTLFLCRHNVEIKLRGREIDDSDEAPRTISVTKDTERSLRYEIFSLSVPFNDIALTVRAELRNEFWTLTFLGDLSRSERVGSTNYTFSRICNAFSNVGFHAMSRLEKAFDFDSVSHTGATTGAELHGNGKVLFNEFCDLIENNILKPCYSSFPAEKDRHSDFIGKYFVDFRGVVFGTIIRRKRPATATPEEISPSVERSQYIEGGLEFEQLKPRQSDTLEGKSRTIHAEKRLAGFISGVDLHVVDSYWPSIKRFYTDEADYETTSRRRIPFRKPDFTVSKFQEGRALYISSLGPKDISSRSQEKTPVRYIIITGSSNRWQLGRLVERINNLGTLRHAAIKSIVELQNASDDIRDLLTLWQQQSSTIDLTRTNEFDRKLEAISAAVPTGLLYRVERSAYYVSLFQQILQSSRLRRVEGFQPYDDFIMRRMGGSFEFIKRLGARYRDFRRAVEHRYQSLRTEELANLGKSIEAIQTLTRKSVDDVGGKQLITNKFLDNAEWFFAPPIAYYVGTAVSHIAEYIGSVDGATFHPNPLWVYGGSAAVVAFAVWLWKTSHHR